MLNIQKISVLGLGYTGLPTAAVLASAGFDVLGVDVNKFVIETINAQKVHIEEPELEELVRRVVQSNKLRASSVVLTSDVYILAVPTPIKEDKTPDLSFIESAVRMVATVLKSGNLIIVESTIPPLTCLKVVVPLIKDLTGLDARNDYFLAHCPERVIPGKILYEIVNNDRVVGGATPDATDKAIQLYSTFVKGKLLGVDVTTAEMVKLMENTFRDVNIALANEFAKIAEDIGINIHDAIRLANHHPRVNIHTPGIGVGGHCIPVVPWFIAHVSPENSKIIKLARFINDCRPKEMAEKILRLLNQNPSRSLALFGLAFKPDIDDLRNSPAIEIVKMIAQTVSADIKVVEPYITKLPKELSNISNVKLVSLDELEWDSQLNILLVPHKQFSNLQLINLVYRDFDSHTESVLH